MTDVNGSENVGGFMGLNFGGTVYNVMFLLNNYSAGSVDGENNVGGFVGYNKGDIYNSFSASAVDGDANIGSFVGLNEGTIHNSYYDSDVSFIDGENKGTPKTTSEMKTSETYEFWNFGGEWELIPGNYPSFKEISVNPPLNKSSDGYFEINYLEDLILINNYPNANYKLIRDLDFNDSSSYKSGTINTDWISNDGWSPISRPDYSIFRGDFDGQNHTIKNLYINQPTTTSLGFFDVLGSDSKIDNLVLVDFNVIGYRNVGGLLGYNLNSVLSNNYASGVVFGNQSLIGGLIGCNSYGSIFDSNSESIVSGVSNIGGLAGRNIGVVSNCSSDSNVTATSHYGGGLVGRNYGSIYDSYATGIVTGGTNCGGLSGDSWVAISNSSSSAYVSGINTIGGLVGFNSPDSTISNSYAIGNVVSNSEVAGGLVGLNKGHIYDSYATGDVEGTIRLGGLVGFSYSGNINNTYATGNVTGSDQLGGLIGQLNPISNIQSSFATGDVVGGVCVGGLIGRGNGLIDQCYATGDVSGTSYVGGFIGDVYNEYGAINNSYSLGDVYRSSGTSSLVGSFTGRHIGSITNSYSIGSVSGDDWNPTDKGFIGRLGSTYVDINNFFDSTTSLQTTTAGNALAKTTAEMKTQDTFTGWDFKSIWAIDESTTYPYLKALSYSNDFPKPE